MENMREAPVILTGAPRVGPVEARHNEGSPTHGLLYYRIDRMSK
jgi:hypothetical protein